MAIAAFNGTVKVGSTVINDVVSFDMGAKMAALATTAFSSTTPGTETYVMGLLSMQPKLSCNWNKVDTGQGTLETNFFARTKTTIVISPNGTATYSFGAWITGYDVKGDPKSVVTADYDFQLDGTITLA